MHRMCAVSWTFLARRDDWRMCSTEKGTGTGSEKAGEMGSHGSQSAMTWKRCVQEMHRSLQ